MLRAGRVSYLRLGLEVIRESFLRRWPFTQVLINHRSWAPRRGWEGCFRWLEQVGRGWAGFRKQRIVVAGGW